MTKIFSAGPLCLSSYGCILLMQIILLLTMLLKYHGCFLGYSVTTFSSLLQYYSVTCEKNSDHKSLGNLTCKKWKSTFFKCNFELQS